MWSTLSTLVGQRAGLGRMTLGLVDRKGMRRGKSGRR